MYVIEAMLRATMLWHVCHQLHWSESCYICQDKCKIIVRFWHENWYEWWFTEVLLDRLIIKHSSWAILNSSPPSDAYMHRWTGSALVQIMACHLLGTKPLSEPILDYYQLLPKEHTAVKFQSKYKTFYSRKCIWKYWRPFCPGGDELTDSGQWPLLLTWFNFNPSMDK